MKLQTWTSCSLRTLRHLAQSGIDRRLAALAAVVVAITVPARSELVTYLSLDTSDGLTLNGDAAITTGGQGKFGEALTVNGTGLTAIPEPSADLLGGLGLLALLRRRNR